MRWRRRRREAENAATVRRGQLVAAVDLAITESTWPMPMLDPFDVMRTAEEMFGLQLAYTEARTVLLERLGHRGYLALQQHPLPAWMTEEPLG